MWNVMAARWIGVVALVAALSGCTGGGSAAGPTTGTGTPAAGSAPTESVTLSKDLIGDGPVLTVDAVPFPEPSAAALPAPRRQALQQALDETVRDSTRMPGVTAAVLTPIFA
jgi:hypothetical protein